MKNLKLIMLAAVVSISFYSCKDDDEVTPTPTGNDFSGTYVQADQMARPAINTVFVEMADKDQFNVTIPANQNAQFQSKFQTKLMALSPAYANAGDKNALGQDAATFTGLLATDVLNLSLDGKTTFFDGTNVLTGRALEDDVISIELLLIFGGEMGTENPTLSDDNVDANDKAFLSTFPYLASPW